MTSFAQLAKVVHTILPSYNIGDDRNDRIAAILAMRRMWEMSRVSLSKLINKVEERISELANKAGANINDPLLTDPS